MQRKSIPHKNTQTDYQQAIPDAFYAGDYVQAARLCDEILLTDPENKFAKTYLARVEAAWDRGYGIPMELRRQFHRAERLVKLRNYAESRAIYESLLSTIQSLDVSYWSDLEKALLRLSDVEAAAQILEEATVLFTQDQWEAALEHCRQATALAPDFEYAQVECTKIQDVLEKTQQITSALLTPDTPAKWWVEALLQALVEAHMLQMQWPESQRVQELVSNAKATVAKAREKLVTEFEECLALTESLVGQQVRVGLLRRAHTLMTYLEQLPGDPLVIDDLAYQLYQREAEIDSAREFETYLAQWLQSEDNAEVTDQNVFSDHLSAITDAMRRMWVRWQQIDTLLPEYEFCLRALKCNTLEDIAHFARDTSTNLLDRTDMKWLDAWKRARMLIMDVSKDIVSLREKSSRAKVSAVNSELRDIILIAEEQIFPLRQLTNAIAAQWSRVLDSTISQ